MNEQVENLFEQEEKMNTIEDVIEDINKDVVMKGENKQEMKENEKEKEKNIKISLSDGSVRTLSIDLYKHSGVLVECLNTSTDDDEIPTLPFPDITPATFDNLLQFLILYNKEGPLTIERPVSDNYEKDVNPKAYYDYIQNIHPNPARSISSVIRDLLMAANCLNITPLVDLCCSKIAANMKPKTLEELKKENELILSEKQEKELIKEFNKFE